RRSSASAAAAAGGTSTLVSAAVLILVNRPILPPESRPSNPFFDRTEFDRQPPGLSLFLPKSMATDIVKARHPDAVIQFSVFTPNRLGRLHDLVRLLGAQGVHVLALMVLDTTDSAIIRVVVDDPDSAREMLHREGFPFTESKLVV